VFKIPKSSTYTITRGELRHVLVAFGMNEKSIQSIFATMDKSHKHINIITFSSLLEKAGMSRSLIGDVFRRIGMDDITIANIFNMADEQKINAEIGRLYNAEIEFD
jgi:hypothetical protein